MATRRLSLWKALLLKALRIPLEPALDPMRLAASTFVLAKDVLRRAYPLWILLVFDVADVYERLLHPLLPDSFPERVSMPDSWMLWVLIGGIAWGAIAAFNDARQQVAPDQLMIQTGPVTHIERPSNRAHSHEIQFPIRYTNQSHTWPLGIREVHLVVGRMAGFEECLLPLLRHGEEEGLGSFPTLGPAESRTENIAFFDFESTESIKTMRLEVVDNRGHVFRHILWGL